MSNQYEAGKYHKDLVEPFETWKSTNCSAEGFENLSNALKNLVLTNANENIKNEFNEIWKGMSRRGYKIAYP